MQSTEPPLADRVNVEPPIVGGMSHTELTLVAGSAFVVLFVATAFGAWLTHAWVLMAVLPPGGTVVVIAIAARHMATLKRNRPDGYHAQWLRKRMARFGISRMRTIEHHGHWRLGRDL